MPSALEPRRAQFACGPALPGFLDGWPRHPLPGGLVVAAHPALPVTAVRAGERSLLLLGTWLDPEDPAAGDTELALRVLARMEHPEDAWALAAGLAGRFVVAASRGDRTLVFQDAGGFRALCYGARADGARVFASEPRLAATLAGAELAPEARAFLGSDVFRARRGRPWWPAPRTPFAGIRRLVPNLALDLAEGTPRRLFPPALRGPASLDAVVPEAARLLRGVLRAAAARHPLMLFLTGGWDSRLVLAAARDVAEGLECVSIHHAGGQPRDVEVAAEVARRLGVAHRVVEAAERPSAAFLEAYEAHAFLAHEPAAAIAEAVAPLLGGERVALTGHLSEVLKGFYTRPPPFAGALRADRLAAWAGFPARYAEEAFGEWLAGLGRCRGVDPLDLFYWEQNCGSQLAAWMLEWDLVWRDALAPLACHRLLTLLLAAPARHRRVGELHRRLMVELWPEVLEVPLKGRRFPARARSTPAQDAARGLRFVAKELKQGLRYWRGRLRPGT